MSNKINNYKSEKEQGETNLTYHAPQVTKLKSVEIEGGGTSVPENGSGFFMDS